MMVIEATGTLGRQVVGRILDEGYDVQCLVSPRPPRADFLHDWDATFVNVCGYMFCLKITYMIYKRVMPYCWDERDILLDQSCTKMALPEMDVGGGIGEGRVESNGFVKSSEPSIGVSNSATSASPIGTTYEGNEALGYANILRSRNKFVKALCIYDSVLEKSMGRQAFESFSEAVKLDPKNACALTHCGILYKDEGRLVESAEVLLISFKYDN
ncbi:probable UDP-N-acetylglucosamine--peptide N-acetylglucosaminyltransferase SPINDLY isoform X1 [Tanacetum coccineum]